MDRTVAPNLQAELEKLEAAISKLQNGERIASVSYDGHSVSYAGISLNELLQQRQRLLSRLAEYSQSSKRQVVFATHKGVHA